MGRGTFVIDGPANPLAGESLFSELPGECGLTNLISWKQRPCLLHLGPHGREGEPCGSPLQNTCEKPEQGWAQVSAKIGKDPYVIEKITGWRLNGLLWWPFTGQDGCRDTV